MSATPSTCASITAATSLPTASPTSTALSRCWAYAKLRLAKMKGIQRHMFYLHLKEAEFRFNHRRDNLYKLLLKFLREQPI
jgi:hypothetical protein